MRRLVTGFVVFAVLVSEAALAVFFAVLSLSGDSFHIARDMAIDLGVAMLLTAVPAVVLWWKGRPVAGAITAIASAAVFTGLWRFA